MQPEYLKRNDAEALATQAGFKPSTFKDLVLLKCPGSEQFEIKRIKLKPKGIWYYHRGDLLRVLRGKAA